MNWLARPARGPLRLFRRRRDADDRVPRCALSGRRASRRRAPLAVVLPHAGVLELDSQFRGTRRSPDRALRKSRVAAAVGDPRSALGGDAPASRSTSCTSLRGRRRARARRVHVQAPRRPDREWSCDGSRSARPRCEVRARRADAGVVHAPGRSLAAGVPRVARAARLLRARQPPELCAEVTLQPVRRHGVDAAVIFADIMTPVVAMGVDVKLVEGVGPVIDPLTRGRAAISGRGRAGGVRGDPHRSRRARRRKSGRRLLRRAVHGRGVSDRGKAEPRLREGEGVHVRRAARHGTRCWTRSRTVRALRARAGRRRRGRDPALRLVGRRAFSGRLRASSSRRTARRSSTPSTCRRSIRHRTSTLLAADGDGRRCGSGSTGGCRSTRAGSSSANAGTGQPRPGRAARAVGPARGGRPRRARARRAAATATSSTSATGSSRRPTRTPVTRLTELVQTHTVEARV